MTQIIAAWYATHARKQPVNMPTLSFSEDEIEDDGDISAVVNPAGLAYVGRKHKGKKVRIIVMKGSESTEPR